MYDYMIATEAEGVAGLVNVYAVGTVTNTSDRVEPQGLALRPYSNYRVSASGKEYGDGFPFTVWTFGVIKQGQLDGLLAYLDGAQSANVYIKTRKDDRTYGTYKAIMHRPKIEEGEITPAYSGNWHNVTIRFTMLEAQ